MNESVAEDPSGRADTGPVHFLVYLTVRSLISSPLHRLHAGYLFYFIIIIIMLLYRVCIDSVYAADCTQINVCVALSMLLKRSVALRGADPGSEPEM